MILNELLFQTNFFEKVKHFSEQFLLTLYCVTLKILSKWSVNVSNKSRNREKWTCLLIPMYKTPLWWSSTSNEYLLLSILFQKILLLCSDKVRKIDKEYFCSPVSYHLSCINISSKSQLILVSLYWSFNRFLLTISTI